MKPTSALIENCMFMAETKDR